MRSFNIQWVIYVWIGTWYQYWIGPVSDCVYAHPSIKTQLTYCQKYTGIIWTWQHHKWTSLWWQGYSAKMEPLSLFTIAVTHIRAENIRWSTENISIIIIIFLKSFNQIIFIICICWFLCAQLYYILYPIMWCFMCMRHELLTFLFCPMNVDILKNIVFYRFHHRKSRHNDMLISTTGQNLILWYW